MSDGSNLPPQIPPQIPTPGEPKVIKTNDQAPETNNVTPTPSFLGLSNQKPISEMSVRDVFLWRNVIFSAVTFAVGLSFVMLVKQKEYSFVTLFGRILQLQIFAFLGYAMYLHYVKKEQTGTLSVGNWQITEESLKPFITSFVSNFNEYSKKFGDVVYWSDPQTTLKFLAAVQFFCFLGNRVTGLTIFAIVFVYLFTVPKVYEWKKKEIDEILEKISKILNEQVGKIVEKIPPSIKDKLAFLAPKQKSE